jgi:hypothetical protein
MREFLEQVTGEKIDDQQLDASLYEMTHYNWLFNHAPNNEKWLERHNLRDSTEQELKEYLNQIIQTSRNNISKDIALKMFELSLDLTKKYLHKFF